MRSALLALCFSSLASALASAQTLSGNVLGPTAPLSDALVIMHDSTGERARAQTSTSGVFSFTLEPGEVPIFLLVRAIGYAPQSYRLPVPSTQPVSVTMVPFALPLPELTVRAVRAKCPNRPNPVATLLWESARHRYALPAANQGIEFYGRRVDETVSQDRIGYFDERRLQPGMMGRSGTVRAPAAASMDKSIYARRLDGDLDLLLSIVKGDDIYAHWWYPALDSWEIDHWLQPSFRDNHTFSVDWAPNGQFDIIFCPRTGKKPSVSGTLTLSKDTALQSAAWAFATGKPDENAGGRVDFLPVTAQKLSLLQPTMGVFWRRLGGWQRYVQRAMSFTRMAVSADQRIPGR